MKVTEQEKAKTRIKILEASVDVIIEKGFKSASMREIAKRAGVGDATIYNYFPSKEKLLYGYCEYIQQQVMESLQGIEDFHEYTLHEQLQQLVELQLEVWLPAREFLTEVFKLTYHSPTTGSLHLTKTRELYTLMVTDMLEAAIEAGEIPDQPYTELLPRLFWDYQTGLLAYWLKDDSEGFANTSQVINKSMDIVSSLLHQGLIGKSLDLISFLFRTHVMAGLGSLNFGQEGEENKVSKKRPFMQARGE
ncbi:TetR/AcrR family transcriptional regulator [Leucothrix arctica]|uniref:TetR/AcrR family transcriptional regulator n=1 Tax=Leucothrix arctica TaxID=1481894 RepID=A0A317CBF7_9GAMM|nr:TetR/AcrR family transcriptional regulator [Leucothrix arctica]PWQ93422.1 TetR/AcrR family transcriptional regulator [Leucothrix arctica]